MYAESLGKLQSALQMQGIMSNTFWFVYIKLKPAPKLYSHGQFSKRERENWDSRLENVRLDAASGAIHDLSHPTFTPGQNSHPSFVFPELSGDTTPVP